MHDQVKQGRNLYFIFIAPKRLRLNKEVRWTVVNFKAEETNPTLIPPETYENQWFYHRHILLFVNGVYIEPERYDIIDNKIYMKPNLHKGYPEPNIDNFYTMIYLKDYQILPKGNSYPELDEDIEDDSDQATFFEGYNKPYIINPGDTLDPSHIVNVNLPILTGINNYVVKDGETVIEVKDHTGLLARPIENNKITEIPSYYNP